MQPQNALGPPYDWIADRELLINGCDLPPAGLYPKHQSLDFTDMTAPFREHWDQLGLDMTAKG